VVPFLEAKVNLYPWWYFIVEGGFIFLEILNSNLVSKIIVIKNI
jgi:hypothetical protein